MEKAEIHLKQTLKAAENWAKFHQVIPHVDVEFIIGQLSITKTCKQLCLCKKIKKQTLCAPQLARSGAKLDLKQ